MTKPLAEVYHLDLFGLRKDKYQTLLDSTISSLPWNKIDCRAPEYSFIAKDFDVLEQYEQGFSVSDLFTVNSSGIETKRDALFIDFDKVKLAKRLELLLSNQYDSKFIADFNIQDSSSYSLKRKIAACNYSEKHLSSVLYRPFDTRHIYYDKELLGRAFYNVMQHFVKGDNVGLITCRQQSTFDFQHILVTKEIIDRNMISLQTKEYNYAFPLYLYPETTTQLLEKPVRTPNLNPEILQQIAGKLGLTFTPEKSGDGALPEPLNTANSQGHILSDPADNHTFAPIDLLDYIYAVLHSPNYRETYKEFLKIDFPRVPYPEPQTFWPLVKLGAELRQLHLLGGEGSIPSAALPTPLWVESPVLDKLITTYPNDGDNIVTRKINKNDFELANCGGEFIRPEQIQGRVWINDQQYFDGVPVVAWEFYIGGYQPAQKWLKDRHGRKLNFEDIQHYQKVIVALTETHRIMQTIDSIWHPVE